MTNERWKEDGLNSEVFVSFNVEDSLAVIGGTFYGGEMKKVLSLPSPAVVIGRNSLTCVCRGYSL